MADRFSSEHDINATKVKVGYAMDFSLTSAEEQKELNGFLKASRPVGNDGPVIPPTPGYKYIGTCTDDESTEDRVY